MSSTMYPSRTIASRELAPEISRDFSPTRSQTLLRLLMIVSLYAIPVLAALQRRVDWDLWWHLRVGQWVVDQGSVPATDPFSVVGQGRPWLAYSWLFEVVVFGLFRALGLPGVLAYTCILSLAVVAALHQLIARRLPHFLAATALTGVAALALTMLFQPRPWLFTILFVTLTVDAVLLLREGRTAPLLWVLPVVYVVWANVHIQFVYGLFVLGLACVAPLMDRFLGWENPGNGAGRVGSRSWWCLLGLFLVCLLATLVNPYHLRLYGVVVEYATQPGPFRFVNELKALEFREPCDWVMLGLFGGAAFVLGRRKHLSTFDLLLLSAAAVLAFRARRDLWFVVVVACALLASAWPGAVAAGDRFLLSARQRGGVVAAILGLIVLVVWVRGLNEERMQATVAEVFPVRAVAEVRARGYPGPLFNDFNWGGYLIWALPEHPVCLDGRTNLHGDERIERIGAVWAGGDHWQDDPDLQATNLIVADNANPLAGLLRHDVRFERVYADDLASVFVRRSQPIVASETPAVESGAR
jgi:hypothetical protein